MLNLEFTEVIKVKDGKFCNLPLHLLRMNKTILHFWKAKSNITLNNSAIPENMRTGLVKCRIVYCKVILSMEFTPYNFREINNLTVVISNDIDYSFKYKDRSSLDELFSQRKNADDIIIVKNGLVTDTSFSNIVFKTKHGELITPSTPLLFGTKRQQLLNSLKIKESPIFYSEIQNYNKAYLINAMIDLEDNICINTSNITF